LKAHVNPFASPSAHFPPPHWCSAAAFVAHSYCQYAFHVKSFLHLAFEQTHRRLIALPPIGWLTYQNLFVLIRPQSMLMTLHLIFKCCSFAQSVCIVLQSMANMSVV